MVMAPAAENRGVVGRPRKYHNRIATSVAIDADVLIRFRELCYRNRISMSEGVNQLIKNHLAKFDVR